MRHFFHDGFAHYAFRTPEHMLRQMPAPTVTGALVPRAVQLWEGSTTLAPVQDLQQEVAAAPRRTPAQQPVEVASTAPSAQVTALRAAAEEAMPFCEICSGQDGAGGEGGEL